MVQLMFLPSMSAGDLGLVVEHDADAGAFLEVPDSDGGVKIFGSTTWRRRCEGRVLVMRTVHQDAFI